MRPRVLLVVCAFLLAGSAMATSFVVPNDDELIEKSAAIATGTVEGSYVQETDGSIETIYEVRVERALKGLFKGAQLVRVASPGGIIGDRGLYVAGAAHFQQGERVLLFLTRHNDRWQTTDMTLGKFRFVTSTIGERLLVREMEDVVGWDHDGKVHHEKVRRTDGFLRFIEERVRGDAPRATDYIVEASSVTLPPKDRDTRFELQPLAPFPANTYVSWVSNMPNRWPNIAAGVTFHKRVDQNLPGAADGGVSVIRSGLAAWTNEGGSNINLIYGGTTTTPSRDFDTVHVVEFNDPQGRISGSWGGSGTIGLCFLSFSGTHPFNSQTWWNISDADVVFQDGFPGTHAAFPAAMTHELGHGLGWRHSNQNHQTDGACVPSVEECTSAAIMNSSVSSSYGFTLQTWDINASQVVYPGTGNPPPPPPPPPPPCTAPSITSQPQSATIQRGFGRTLSVGANGTALSYQWYTGSSGNTANPIAGATGTSIIVSPSSTTSYWVRVTNTCGAVNSSTATITVTNPPPATPGKEFDFTGDGRADVGVFRPSQGMWYIQGASTVQFGQNGDIPVPADYDGNGRYDVAIYRPSNGQWHSPVFGSLYWGQPGDIPVPADYNGDGRADIAVYRPSNGYWYSPAFGSVLWGQPGGDIPVPADYNGDGRADIAIFRPSNGTWYTTTVGPVYWGAPGDIPVPADYTGDGIDDIAIFRPSSGVWHMRGAGATQWGQNGDIPIPADYNGDGRAEVALYRPSTGYWYTQSMTVYWGAPGDFPVTSPVAARHY